MTSIRSQAKDVQRRDSKLQSRFIGVSFGCKLRAEHSDLAPQRLELAAFVLQKAHCQFRLATDTAWRERIGIGKLIVTISKIACFDPAFVNQRLDAVIRFADTDAQLGGELPLTEGWVRFERFQHTVVRLCAMSSLVH